MHTLSRNSREVYGSRYKITKPTPPKYPPHFSLSKHVWKKRYEKNIQPNPTTVLKKPNNESGTVLPKINSANPTKTLLPAPTTTTTTSAGVSLPSPPPPPPPSKLPSVVPPPPPPLPSRMENKCTVSYPLCDVSVEQVQKFLTILGGKWGKNGDVFDEHERDLVPENKKIHFTYGEVLPSGVRKMSKVLAVDKAKKLLDLGCGKFRLAIQMFLEHTNLIQVIGVEYSKSRFDCARQILRSLVNQNNLLFQIKSDLTDSICITIEHGSRSLELRHGDLFDYVGSVSGSDVIVCETAIPVERMDELAKLLSLVKLGARVLLYHDLCKLVDSTKMIQVIPGSFNQAIRVWTSARFERIYNNQGGFDTSWVDNHKFDLWKRVS